MALLHRAMAHEHVVAGIATALQVGALTSDVVAVEARKAAHSDPQPTLAELAARPAGTPVQLPEDIASLTQHRLATLPIGTRPLPSVAAYDELLPSRRAPAPPAIGQGDA